MVWTSFFDQIDKSKTSKFYSIRVYIYGYWHIDMLPIAVDLS